MLVYQSSNCWSLITNNRRPHRKRCSTLCFFLIFNELAGAGKALETKLTPFSWGKDILYQISPPSFSFQKWLHVYSTENIFHVYYDSGWHCCCVLFMVLYSSIMVIMSLFRCYTHAQQPAWLLVRLTERCQPDVKSSPGKLNLWNPLGLLSSSQLLMVFGLQEEEASCC